MFYIYIRISRSIINSYRINIIYCIVFVCVCVCVLCIRISAMTSNCQNQHVIFRDFVDLCVIMVFLNKLIAFLFCFYAASAVFNENRACRRYHRFKNYAITNNNSMHVPWKCTTILTARTVHDEAQQNGLMAHTARS